MANRKNKPPKPTPLNGTPAPTLKQGVKPARQGKRSPWWLILLLMAIMFAAGVLAAHIFAWSQEHDSDGSRVPPKAPFAKEVKRIMDPLVYNGIERLLQPGVQLDVDFERRTWSLVNMHHFTEDGKILLLKGKYGLCAELSTYVYDQTRTLFGPRYQVDFADVFESSFFFVANSSHIVLRVIDRNSSPPEVFLLDPSFHRYGHIEEFPDYRINNTMDFPDYIRDRSGTEEFSIDGSSPVIIHKGRLINLAIRSNDDGSFDNRNFTLALTATKKGHFMGRYIFAYRRVNGAAMILEDGLLAKAALPKDKYILLRDKLKEWFLNISEQADTSIKSHVWSPLK